MTFLSVLEAKSRSVDIKADLFHHKKNIQTSVLYKLKILLTLPYFGPEIAVYKTTNLQILTKL